MKPKRAGLGLALAAALALGACSGGTAPAVPSVEVIRPDVGVQMFQWTWDAIAQECTDFLGPAGYAWVLTSPPQEHITGPAWWTHYQPVSYQIESRLGTREQFASMVQTCNQAGVEVYADAVINHMTGQDSPGTGWAGSSYEHYNYPGIYGPADFHYCDTHNHDITSYRDAQQVQFCELVNLADLATETEPVRATITAYLEDLLSLGVSGFRIDAAKHMPAEDVAEIISRLPQDTAIVHEVIRGAGEPIAPEDYLASGDVYEFTWGRELKGLLDGTTFRMFFRLGEGSGYAASGQAVSFVDNHDTERNGETLNYRDGWRYEMAQALTLAHPYGRPAVLSSFAFSDRDAGAVTRADGAVVDAVCVPDAAATTTWKDGDWVCQHRWPAVVAMLQWRAVAQDAPLTDQWDGPNAIAFGRADRAFVVANRGADPLTETWQTSLPEGRYCNVTAVTPDGECELVEVSADGSFSATVPGESLLAIHVAARS